MRATASTSAKACATAEYLGDFALYSGGLDRQLAMSETVYDAQIGYDFPDDSGVHGCRCTSRANLTDERSATVAIRRSPTNI